MSHKERVTAMYDMINQGQMMEAFEKYYHEDVVMIECTGDVREGKATSREFEKNFMSSIKDVHGGGATAITSDEDAGVTMVETWMDVTFADGNRMKLEQIARQKWQGDQIIEERFYYDTRGME